MNKTNTVRLLGMDPGTKNFGIAVTEVNRKTGVPRVLVNSMLAHPFDTFTDGYRSGVQQFLRDIRKYIVKYEPDGFIAERFQSRGLRGLSVEAVSFMLGLMASHFGSRPHKFITAATWKNDVNKKLAQTEFEDLKNFYKCVGVPPHQVDAVLMSLYGIQVATGVAVKYKWESLINQIERTSTSGRTK